MCGLCLRRTGVNPLWLFWGNFSRKTTGSKIKQEKSGWVAIAPLRKLQRPEMPAAQGLFGLSVSLFLGGLLPPVVQINKGCKCK